MPTSWRAARAFGRVASALRSAGRTPAARAFDALIAATAVAHGLPLFTGNPRDFEGIPELQLHPVDRVGSASVEQGTPPRT